MLCLLAGLAASPAAAKDIVAPARGGVVGGTNKADQDGNNGSGNESDCEDDSNGTGTPGSCDAHASNEARTTARAHTSTKASA